LDFVYNQDVKDLTKLQIKRILDRLRRELFSTLNEIEFKTNKELGKGWKMLTSAEDPKIIGLEIITNYNSIIDNSVQTIKLEISFRKKLKKPTKIMAIKHEFVDALGDPILRKDVEIEVIDLIENFAEKFRALVIRKNVAIRDIYDIYFILKNNLVKIDKELVDLILVKINENSEKRFTQKDFIDFIKNLKSKLSDLNEKEISSLLKSGEKVNVKEMIQMIIKNFEDLEI
jgi:predicted nucleotidyltransferase component of viral defense system